MAVNYLATARRVLAERGERHASDPARAVAPVSDTRVDEVVYQSAVDILNRVGARHIMLDGIFTIAIWRTTDTAMVRWAARSLHGNAVNVVYLEDPSIPDRYRVRCDVRDRERDPYGDEFGTDYYTWKANALNRMFLEKGVLGKPGRLKPETVQHGEDASRTNQRIKN